MKYKALAECKSLAALLQKRREKKNKKKILESFEEDIARRHEGGKAGKWCREERVMGLRSCFRS